MRRIVLDTETTGLSAADGHRIIEVACIELDNRTPTGQRFHEFVNPERKIDAGAARIHGIDSGTLDEKPKFSEIASQLYQFIEGAELIIHNAEFDLEFLDTEFRLTGGDYPKLRSVCTIVDTIEIAREMRPGRRNSLDALASEYGIDISMRTTHGALLDASILVEVYLSLTVGQTTLELATSEADSEYISQRKPGEVVDVLVVSPTQQELSDHEAWLDYLDQASANGAIWRRLETKET